MNEEKTTNKPSKGKGIYLFLALLLPICIFLFLKFFGRNEFAVEPLFTSPETGAKETCFAVSYPYKVPDSVILAYPMAKDSLLLLHFGKSDEESVKQINRAHENFTSFPLRYLQADETALSNYRRKCIFLMHDPYDLALIDRQGRIRGHYVSSDREDVDRLITEVTIILKRY